MQIKQILRNAIAELTNLAENPQFEAEILLAHVLGKSREWLTAHSADEVGDCAGFFALLDRRLAGEPLAYIFGDQEFFGHKFLVNRDVLIPRPETELIVEEVLTHISGNEKIVDVGTGSGAIGIAVALAKPQTEVTLLDISTEALAVAQKNADILGAQVRTICSKDFFDQDVEQFDIVLANLPYIPTTEPQIQKSVLDYEPHIALFGGNDGLDHYRHLFAKIANSSHKPRVIICEIAYNQGASFRQLTQEFLPGYTLTIRKDHAGFDRTPVLVFNSSV